MRMHNIQRLQGKHMAQARYIEKFSEDTWKSVSSLFATWLHERKLAEDIGWSEGDTLKLSGDVEFYCLLFPDKYGEKVRLFEQWAETTDRLYGLRYGQEVKIPRKPELSIALPPEPVVEVPSWLK